MAHEIKPDRRQHAAPPIRSRVMHESLRTQQITMVHVRVKPWRMSPERSADWRGKRRAASDVRGGSVGVSRYNSKPASLRSRTSNQSSGSREPLDLSGPAPHALLPEPLREECS